MPLLLVALAGCAQIPALDGSISDAARAAPYPVLTPMPGIAPVTAAQDSDLAARVAALHARAAWLRQIDIAALQ
ncbi:hypothetical protein [Yoonia tamlensis]|uniref:hypothetical protein n=1 Tax=Yoonia tamlensis TaxID=390270 RepID=UPI001F61DDFB|nr:hypothetical protein [Yoonia tamlensis]